MKNKFKTIVLIGTLLFVTGCGSVYNKSNTKSIQPVKSSAQNITDKEANAVADTKIATSATTVSTASTSTQDIVVIILGNTTPDSTNPKKYQQRFTIKNNDKVSHTFDLGAMENNKPITLKSNITLQAGQVSENYGYDHIDGVDFYCTITNIK